MLCIDKYNEHSVTIRKVRNLWNGEQLTSLKIFAVFLQILPFSKPNILSQKGEVLGSLSCRFKTQPKNIQKGLSFACRV
jgi:hypothetical protein